MRTLIAIGLAFWLLGDQAAPVAHMVMHQVRNVKALVNQLPLAEVLPEAENHFAQAAALAQPILQQLPVRETLPVVEERLDQSFNAAQQVLNRTFPKGNASTSARPSWSAIAHLDGAGASTTLNPN
jgi:non-ribosomal peptide synthetase component E (peptide arylation enzyme)